MVGDVLLLDQRQVIAHFLSQFSQLYALDLSRRVGRKYTLIFITNYDVKLNIGTSNLFKATTIKTFINV